MRSNNGKTTRAARPPAPQPVEKSSFAISCTSRAVARKFLVNSSNPRMPHAELRLRGNTIPEPHPSATRPDLQMMAQLNAQAVRATEFHKNWVETHSINITRSPAEEKHYLKILVRSATLRQKTEGSTSLSRMIVSRNNNPPQQPAASHLPESSPPVNKRIVTKANAFDLDFVVKRLMEDIDIVYERHGYSATLKAFNNLSPWKLDS